MAKDEDNHGAAVISRTLDFTVSSGPSYGTVLYHVHSPHIGGNDKAVNTGDFPNLRQPQLPHRLPFQTSTQPHLEPPKNWKKDSSETPEKAANALGFELYCALLNIWGQNGKNGELRGQGTLALKLFDDLMDRRAKMLEDPIISRKHPHVHDYLTNLIAHDENGLELLMLTAAKYLKETSVPTLEEYTDQCSVKNFEFAMAVIHEKFTAALKANKEEIALENLRVGLAMVNATIASPLTDARAMGYFEHILGDVVFDDPTTDMYDSDNMEIMPPSLRMLIRLANKYQHDEIPTYREFLFACTACDLSISYP